jgi:glucose-6-phosphate 1-dehydrogenase
MATVQNSTNNMSNTTTPVVVDLVIFGGAGDLSLRKLLPALYMAHLHGSLAADLRIVATGRQAWKKAEFKAFVEAQSKGFIAAKDLDPAQWQSFLERLDFVRVDAANAADFEALAQVFRTESVRIYYLATASALFEPICQNLHQAKLILSSSRVVLEKPLGLDLPSAQHINKAVGAYFLESQIYRIDHYLGKETVQNLMVLRFGNSIFEPLWRAPHIRSVQITVAESIGVGSRAGFYDGTGALRDMVQNHLLQLLTIVAMEPPVSLDADAVRDEKLKVLRSLKPMTASDVANDCIRGQYSAGVVDGQMAQAYLNESQVPERSQTETFVALKLQINNWRWAGVPFFLRTGKRMPEKLSEIVIDFAPPPHSIFQNNAADRSVGNRLIIRLQPDETVQLHMLAKEPGSGMRLKPVQLNLDLHTAFSERRAEAYERLLMDVIKGRLTHFMRRDELEAAWRWIDPIQAAWQQQDQAPRPYASGTWGPAAAAALVAREGCVWSEEV